MKTSAELLIEKEQLLAVYDSEDRIVSSVEKKSSLEKNIRVPAFQMGGAFSTLMELCGGFRPGNVIIISGFTKHGKTLLAQSFTVALEKKGTKSLWFQYELMDEEFLDGFAGGVLPMFYLPNKLKENTLSWVEDRILEGKIKYGIRCVFIDHLLFLVDFEKMRNSSIEIGAVMRKLKDISKEHKICIFLLTHVGKVEKGREEMIPTYHNLRDSSLIAQESDTVLMIGRKKDDAENGIFNQARVSVEVSRRTGAMRKIVKLIKADGLLRELTPIEPHGVDNNEEE